VNQKGHHCTAIFSAFETVDRGQCSLPDKAGASTIYLRKPHTRRLECARISAHHIITLIVLHCNF
jgi:hypothetical protein